MPGGDPGRRGPREPGLCPHQGPRRPGSRDRDPAPIRLKADIEQTYLLGTIRALNKDPAIDGILVQLPLPSGIDSQAVIEAVDPAKDVDGFHPTNVGHLADGRPVLVPCTPLGVMKLLRPRDPDPGAVAVVLGRSAIVGRPMARLLLAADATVTVAHSRTRDLPAECRRADILVAAVGKPGWYRATGSSQARR